MTKVEFDDLLRRAGVQPEDFWTEFNKQRRLTEAALKDYSAAEFIDHGLSWASTSQGHEYWQHIKATVAKLPPKPYITCCIWNGHPLFCSCPTKKRFS